MESKNILITGAGGFIGRNLTEYFVGKYNIFAPNHASLNLLDENIVMKYIAGNRINYIIHCAGVGGSRKNNYCTGSPEIVAINLRIFYNLVRCLTPDKYMINLGSGAEYDKRHYEPKMSEDFFDVFMPGDEYGFSKYLISKYIEKVENIVNLRIFGLYGKYEDYRYRFISNAIVKNLLHLPIQINQNVVFDYLYIEDLVDIVERLIQKRVKERFLNATPTKSIDLVSLADLINKNSGFKSDIIVLNEGMNREYSGDNSKLLGEIGYFAFTEYEEGVKQLYNYYASILSQLDVETIKADPYLKSFKTID
jgi:nucleoside-diphosphate-sugar epimerase